MIFFLTVSIVISQDDIIPILNEKFPAHELQSDLAFIKNKAVYKKYNQDGYLYVGKERFTQLYDSLKSVINEKGEMSRLEFYFLTTPFVRSLQDEVSYYSLNGDYTYNRQLRKEIHYDNKFVVPLFLYTFNDTVFASSDSSDLNKSQILSINDIPIKQIFSELTERTSFKRYNYYCKHYYGTIGLHNHPLLTYTLYGFENEVLVKHIPYKSDSIFQTKMELLQVGDSVFYDILDKNRIRKTWYYLDVENDYAVLYLYSLPENEVNIHFFNDIFRKIKKMQPKGLIIDISTCSWSFDTFWLTLINYLHEGKLWIYSYHDEPKDISKYLKKRLKNKKYIIGNYSDINEDYRFEGQTYLVTGPSTSSSAVRFADILRYNKIVEKIYGRETRTRTTQYDWATTYDLPVTGLQLKLSTNLLYALDKNTDTHGLIPDIIVEPNNVEEFWKNSGDRLVVERVIELIDQENQNNENTSD